MEVDSGLQFVLWEAIVNGNYEHLWEVEVVGDIVMIYIFTKYFKVFFIK